MPYITQKKKLEIEPGLSIASDGIETTGDLCFAIYWLMMSYGLYPPGKETVGPAMTFDSASKAITACECAKLEFYRRYVAPYEDKKIEENGDV